MGKVDALYVVPVAGTALSLHRLKGYDLLYKYRASVWEGGKWIVPLALYFTYTGGADAVPLTSLAFFLLVYAVASHCQKQTVDKILSEVES